MVGAERLFSVPNSLVKYELFRKRLNGSNVPPNKKIRVITVLH